jgi:hypothetical protein
VWLFVLLVGLLRICVDTHWPLLVVVLLSQLSMFGDWEDSSCERHVLSVCAATEHNTTAAARAARTVSWQNAVCRLSVG